MRQSKLSSCVVSIAIAGLLPGCAYAIEFHDVKPYLDTFRPAAFYGIRGLATTPLSLISSLDSSDGKVGTSTFRDRVTPALAYLELASRLPESELLDDRVVIQFHQEIRTALLTQVSNPEVLAVFCHPKVEALLKELLSEDDRGRLREQYEKNVEEPLRNRLTKMIDESVWDFHIRLFDSPSDPEDRVDSGPRTPQELGLLPSGRKGETTSQSQVGEHALLAIEFYFPESVSGTEVDYDFYEYFWDKLRIKLGFSPNAFPADILEAAREKISRDLDLFSNASWEEIEEAWRKQKALKLGLPADASRERIKARGLQ